MTTARSYAEKMEALDNLSFRLRKFKEAQEGLVAAWQEYEDVARSFDGAIGRAARNVGGDDYPFERSFDEYRLEKWFRTFGREIEDVRRMLWADAVAKIQAEEDGR